MELMGTILTSFDLGQSAVFGVIVLSTILAASVGPAAAILTQPRPVTVSTQSVPGWADENRYFPQNFTESVFTPSM